jgi:hypothetical protein
MAITAAGALVAAPATVNSQQRVNLFENPNIVTATTVTAEAKCGQFFQVKTDGPKYSGALTVQTKNPPEARKAIVRVTVHWPDRSKRFFSSDEATYGGGGWPSDFYQNTPATEIENVHRDRLAGRSTRVLAAVAGVLKDGRALADEVCSGVAAGTTVTPDPKHPGVRRIAEGLAGVARLTDPDLPQISMK